MKIFNEVEKLIIKNKLIISSKDLERPWGGFFVIDEKQSKEFLKIFFDYFYLQRINFKKKISSKILVIKSKKRLSWQYHNRRSEIWNVIEGNIIVCKSKNNKEGKLIRLSKNEKIKIDKNIRHRIIGTNEYAIIAEIWIHSDKDNPSDEEDIIRIQDDFNRK